MKLNSIRDLQNVNDIGNEIHALASELYPICRSITGNGVRKTLSIISEIIKLDVHEVPSGTQVFDWTVPKEWNIKDAYIKDENGNKIIDFNNCNLHVVNYSAPVHNEFSLKELKEHIYTAPEHPDWIPYRTSYYDESWGFCLSHNQLCSLRDQKYEVCIDSSLEAGNLTYAECVLPGTSKDTMLLSAHVCHPSLANDNLSGVALLTYLAKYLSQIEHKLTYHFIFAPGTIGSITWLARNESILSRIKHGLVLSCVGDSGGPTYKRSRHDNAEIDQAVEHVLLHSGKKGVIKDFSPYGYDERQYCSPGFDLPVGLFSRSQYGQYPEYHTSADNLNFINAENLKESFCMLSKVIEIIENNVTYVNQNQKCEPQLGKRGLYNAIGGDQDRDLKQLALLWVLNQSDGSKSLLEIAQRSEIPFTLIKDVAFLLKESGLLK
jgi:aminopeptidase-like protein